jgi:hypothetical protein
MGLGQIHMSGFFLAAGFAIVTWLGERRRVPWRAFLLGAALGSLTLIPWALEIGRHPPARTGAWLGWEEAVQLKFWVFWLSDPLGLHLGQILGVHRGGSFWAQLGPFLAEPRVAGHATGGVAAAHALLLVSGVALYAGGAGRAGRTWRGSREPWVRADESLRAIACGWFGFGALLTLSCLWLRRYYLLVSFPLEGLGLARAGLAQDARGRRWLTVIVVSGAFVSAMFLAQVHRDGGAPLGDYGRSYRETRSEGVPAAAPQSNGNSARSSSQSRQRRQGDPGASSGPRLVSLGPARMRWMRGGSASSTSIR